MACQPRRRERPGGGHRAGFAGQQAGRRQAPAFSRDPGAAHGADIGMAKQKLPRLIETSDGRHAVELAPDVRSSSGKRVTSGQFGSRARLPECPVDAIQPDTDPRLEEWLSPNARYAKIWPKITVW